MYSQIIRKSIVWMVGFSFFFTGVSPAFSGSHIMPTGSVKVYKENKLVQVLKQEAVLPDGALLTTEGKCGVRSEDLYLVADDGCTFSIIEGANGKNIRVDNGVIYYAVTQNTRKLAFITPAGVISVMQVLFNADANGGLLKGYLDVSRSQAKFGVLEGGSMVVKTSDGTNKILAGKQITLTMADPIKKEAAKEPADNKKAAVSEKGKEPAPVKEKGAVSAKGAKTLSARKGVFSDIPATYLVGGAVLAGAAVLGIANAGSSDSSTPAPASPVSP